jgi:hypothetical protein
LQTLLKPLADAAEVTETSSVESGLSGHAQDHLMLMNMQLSVYLMSIGIFVSHVLLEEVTACEWPLKETTWQLRKTAGVVLTINHYPSFLGPSGCSRTTWNKGKPPTICQDNKTEDTKNFFNYLLSTYCMPCTIIILPCGVHVVVTVNRK